MKAKMIIISSTERTKVIKLVNNDLNDALGTKRVRELINDPSVIAIHIYPMTKVEELKDG